MAYSNLAYELEAPPARRKKPQKNKQAVKRNHKQMHSKVKNIRRMCAIVVLAFSAGFMISKFVTVHETQQQIAKLQSNLTELESNTGQQIFDLEQSVDLTELEQEAVNRLGMQRPEKYQTIYVNVKRDDMTETTVGEVEGFNNRVKVKLRELGGYIVNMFSIK